MRYALRRGLNETKSLEKLAELAEGALKPAVATMDQHGLPQKSGRPMGDKDKLDITDTVVPYDDHTSTTKLLKALGGLLGREDTTNKIKVLEARTMLEGFAKGAAVLHLYQPKSARVGWMQRLLSWLKKI